MRRSLLLAILLLSACEDGAARPAEDPADQGTRDAVTRDAQPPDPDAGPPGPDPDAGPPEPEPDAAPPEPDPDAAPPAPDPDAGPEPDLPLAEIPIEVVGVETSLGVNVTAAGIANRVTCAALDAEGNPVGDVPLRFEVRPDVGWREGDEEGLLVGSRAGTYHVTCVAPSLGLRDGTPARWDVLAAKPATVWARVEPAQVTAGEATTVSCDAADAEGNPVSAQGAEVAVRPAVAGIQFEGDQLTVTRAGLYQVDCVLPTVVSVGEARLGVVPDLPAQVVATVHPDLPVYEVGSVVGFVPVVVDRFDNVVPDAPVRFDTEPALTPFGGGRWRADEEGRYTLRVTVEPPTRDDLPLEASAEILVDAGGPSIACDSPAEGAMVGRPERLLLEGHVDDVAGLQGFRVDGEDVALDGEGRFAVEVAPTWGLNVHELEATDNVGNTNSVFCSYFASERYIGEEAPLPDAILLLLSQAAVDDGPPDRPLSSLIDLVRRVVDSPALVQTIHTQLVAANPILPNQCRQSLPIIGCIFRLGAEYRAMRIRGPNTFTARLVNGGMQVTARLERIELDVRMTGTLGNSGTLYASHVLMQMTFGFGLRQGRPHIWLRSTDRVEVGDLSSNFDGFLTGDLIDLVFWAFEGVVREQLVGALRDFLEGEVDALLSDLFNGLDLAALGFGLEVPGIGGGEPLQLSLGVDFSAMDANQERLLIGISSVANGPSRQGTPSAGVPIPPGPVRVEPAHEGTAAASIHLGLVNQVLHRLWRAGLFDIGNAAGLLGDLPEGASVGLRVQIPPAVEGTIEGAGVRMHFGPIIGELVYPGFFDEALRLRMAAFLTAPVELVEGSRIVFGGDRGLRIERLHVLVEGASLDAEARATLEQDLGGILQAVVDQALNGALPALPVPDFALPQSFDQFGIEPGTRLGIRDPSLVGTATHFVLDGRFGE